LDIYKVDAFILEAMSMDLNLNCQLAIPNWYRGLSFFNSPVFYQFLLEL